MTTPKTGHHAPVTGPLVEKDVPGGDIIREQIRNAEASGFGFRGERPPIKDRPVRVLPARKPAFK